MSSEGDRPDCRLPPPTVATRLLQPDLIPDSASAVGEEKGNEISSSGSVMRELVQEV